MHWKTHETSVSSGDEKYWGWFSMVEVDTDQKQKYYGRNWARNPFGSIKPALLFLKNHYRHLFIAFPMSTWIEVWKEVYVLWWKLIKHPELWLGVWK